MITLVLELPPRWCVLDEDVPGLTSTLAVDDEISTELGGDRRCTRSDESERPAPFGSGPGGNEWLQHHTAPSSDAVMTSRYGTPVVLSL